METPDTDLIKKKFGKEAVAKSFLNDCPLPMCALGTPGDTSRLPKTSFLMNEGQKSSPLTIGIMSSLPSRKYVKEKIELNMAHDCLALVLRMLCGIICLTQNLKLRSQVLCS